MTGLLVYTLFVASTGAVLMWMWTRHDTENLQAELDDIYTEYAEANVRALAAETRVAWLTSYANRTYFELADTRQELELERIVSDAYAKGIKEQER